MPRHSRHKDEELCPTGFIIDYHFKSSECFEKRFEESRGWKILVFADMSIECVIFSKLLVHRFAEMYNEYKNIV